MQHGERWDFQKPFKSASSRNPSGAVQHCDGHVWIHLRSLTARPLRNDERLPSFWGGKVTFKLQVGHDLEVFGIPKFIISTVFHLHCSDLQHLNDLSLPLHNSKCRVEVRKIDQSNPRKKRSKPVIPGQKIPKCAKIPSILCTQTTSLLGRLRRASQPEKKSHKTSLSPNQGVSTFQ